MKGKYERFTEIILKYGPRRAWQDRKRHQKSVRFVATRPLPDEPVVPEIKLPAGVLIENFQPSRYTPELIIEGDDYFELYRGMWGCENLVVDVPRECFDPQTGQIDPDKARVRVSLENGKWTARVWIMEEVMGAESW